MWNRNFNPITGNRLFTGPSDQEKASQTLYEETNSLNPNVKNRFENYKDPFDFGKISGQVEDTFGGYEDIINRDTAEQISQQQSGAAQSMASRGITGGSALSDTQAGIAGKVNKGKANALANLGIGKSSMMTDLMKYFNQLKFGTEQAATGVDFGNMDNLFRKFGLKGGAISGLSDDTTMDDILAGFNTAGNVAKGAGSLITAFSDVRLKENIRFVGRINNINIYAFNYIGNNRKFIGVIAQEVENIPGAVGTFGGYKFVNYSKIGIPFLEET